MLFRAHILSLKPALDHLINFRQTDFEYLSQDLPGGFQLHCLLWPEDSCHEEQILRVRLSSFAGKQYQ
jgi:hypothetical protein